MWDTLRDVRLRTQSSAAAPSRHRARTGIAVAAVATALAAALVREPHVRGLLKRAAAWPALHRRAAEAREPPWFSRPVASQVGYAPRMRKEFTSPRPFRAFAVVDARTGEVVLRGGAPAREVPTDVLGARGAAWIGDFSGLRTPGRYRVVTDGGSATFPFAVGLDVFDPVARAVQRAFYFQRAFTAIDARHAEGPWVHGDDSPLAPPGVRGGWHDAGDLSLYMATTSTSLFWLLKTFADFAPLDDDTGIPESGDGIPDLLDEARWGVEWMLSVQAADGGFRNSTCETRYGPYGTNTPTSVAPYVAGEVGTVPTARAVGTLAFASVVFRPYDAAFADRCLRAARRGDAWLAARPLEDSDGTTCGAYRADGDRRVGRSVRMLAAAGMLLATGDPAERDAFERNLVPLDDTPGYARPTAFAADLYLRASAGAPERKRALRAQLGAFARAMREEGARSPFGWAGRYHWGSIGAAFARAGLFEVRACLEDPSAGGDCDQALAAVHYALGRNSRAFAYVSGLAGVTRGRTGGFHHWLAALRATPHDFPGMVAGGPNAAPERDDVSNPLGAPPAWGYWGDPLFPRDASTPIDGRFTDNDSWSTNEVAIDWQGSALYVLEFARWEARTAGRTAW